jgi:MFS transporter, MHS family, proline/betaine transporter
VQAGSRKAAPEPHHRPLAHRDFGRWQLKASTPKSVAGLQGARRLVFAGGLGTLILYYDYALYGAVATIIAPLFFPNADGVASLLAALAVFAVSYLARPVGGVFFGWIGDRYGRRRALLITVVGIGVANAAIGVLPTYATVGVVAPILLVVVRIAQGFFAGGEVGGAATMISESAPPERKARYGAFTPMGINSGFALAAASVGAITGVLTRAQLDSWGWRILFLLGLPLALVCYAARRALPDVDETFKDTVGQRIPLFSAVREHPAALAQSIGLAVSVQGTAYFSLTFLSIYLVTYLHYPRPWVYWISAAVTMWAVALMPLAGRLADRVGTLRVATIGLMGYVVLTYPCLLLMGEGHLGWATAGLVLICANMAFLQVATYTITPPLFPRAVRYTATALATNVSSVLAGGTAPYVATWLVERTGNLLSPYYFVAATSLIGLLAVMSIWRHRRRTAIPTSPR